MDEKRTHNKNFFPSLNFIFVCPQVMKRKHAAEGNIAPPTTTEEGEPRRKSFKPIQGGRRTCFVPIVENLKEGEDPSRYTSFFGGYAPYFDPREQENAKWPKCKSCKKGMRFFLQLDLADIPPKIQKRFGDRGYLQLFCCVEGDSDPCEDSCEAFAKGNLVRIVQPPEEGGPIKSLKRICAEKLLLEAGEGGEVTSDQLEKIRDLPTELRDLLEHTRLQGKPRGVVVEPPEDVKEESHPLKILKGWKELADFACYPEKEEKETKEEAEQEEEDRDNPIGGAVPIRNQTVPGCKLGGWANWCQGVDYPICPQCGAQMTNHVVQLEQEEEILPFTWADGGTAQILQCNTHKEVVGFSWACG